MRIPGDYLVALSLLLQFCCADEPSFTFNSGQIPDEDHNNPTESVRPPEEPRFEFNGDQISVNVRHLDAVHRLDDSIFKPNLTTDVHVVNLEDNKLPSLVQATFEHEEHRYVNLESIEPFLSEPVACQIARPDEDTELVLHFKTIKGFKMAQRHWPTNATILFVVEGVHCFEAAGPRSVYSSTDIQFNSDRTVVIKAEPLHAQLHWGSGWADSVRLRTIDLPAKHRIVARESLGIAHGMSFFFNHCFAQLIVGFFPV